MSSGKGCPSCNRAKFAEERKKSNEQFIDELSISNPSVLPLDKYNGAYTRINCKCKIHGDNFVGRPHDLLSGKTGCKKCEWEKRSKSTLFTQDAYEDLIYSITDEVEVVGKYNGMNKPIEFKCGRCGNHWTTLARAIVYDNEGCPRCRSSKGEKEIRTWLKKNNIEFEEQKRFDGLIGLGGKKLSYDFYIKSKNALIEYQGEFHDGTAKLATDESLNKQQEHDKRKREYAEENSIQLIEIWYYDFENIEKILNQYLLRIP